MQVQIIKNAFPENFIDGVYQENVELLKHHPAVWGKNLDHWGKELISGEHLVFIRSLKPEQRSLVQMILMKKGVITQEQSEFLHVQTHVWTNHSRINWHTDPNCHGAATIFLNRQWKEQWGGRLIWKTEEGEDFCYPEFNQMAVLETPLKHCTSNVRAQADFRHTIQLFW